jgi:hypothetical protein
VPLIHQVIPVLLKLRDRLNGTISNPNQQIHPLLRVASHVALKVFDKYMRLFEDASIYWVALGEFVLYLYIDLLVYNRLSF